MEKNIYVIEVRLKDTNPLVWRIIEIQGKLTMHDLHHAIQVAMSWENSHLYIMEQDRDGQKIRFGIPELLDELVNHSDRFKISEVFRFLGDSIDYEYDFGDGWRCVAELRGIIKSYKPIFHYPRIASGAYAAPPEDCGGIPMFEEIRAAYRDKNKKAIKEFEELIGSFDPEEFSAEKFYYVDKEMKIMRKKEMLE